jgi:hypothetical protein
MMNWPAIHRMIPVGKKRRRILLHLFAALLALSVLIPTAQTAHADTSACGTTVICAPPELLNLNQPLNGPTGAQKNSLENLEYQAVQNTISDHKLSAGDADAVKSWGRADAEAELYALLLKAISTSVCSTGQTPGQGCRTTDQQNAVDWLAALEQRKAVLAAQDAGIEYVKWAGLDQVQYQSLLDNSSTTESELESFLSGRPVNYNNTNSSLATAGWCVYRSPAPDSSEYTGYNDITCQSTGLSCITCNPPTPSFDQFTKWGEADANYSLLSSADFQAAANSIALGLGIGLPLGFIFASGFAGAYAAAAGSSLAAAFAGVGVAESALSLAVTTFGAAIFGTVTLVLVALVTAILDGITITNADKLPGQLASLISNAETTPPDPATLESTTAGATSIFSDFVGATLPTPLNQTCDNSDMTTAPGLTVITGAITATHTLDLCLNPTAIPPSSPTDPQFVVQAKGSTTQTASPTITWRDAASGTTTTARLSGNWFIENESVQTLRITYTDWNGTEQDAWLLGDPTDGYAFVNFSPPPGSSTQVDATTCKADGTCSYGTSIDYVGSDGQDYSASVQAYQPPTGEPTFSSGAAEGSPVSFDASSFAPANATAPITYQWQFETDDCGQPCGNNVLNPIGSTPPVTFVPTYTDPITGTTVTHTWQVGGSFAVKLTAIDANGALATDTFSVSVASVPPTLVGLALLCVSPGTQAQCSTGPTGGDVGTSAQITGTLDHTGSADTETMDINWGDSNASYTTGYADAGPLATANSAGNPLTLMALSPTTLAFQDSHIYAKPGTYYITVSVSDALGATNYGGGTDTQTFTYNVVGTQAISFPTIPTHTYGDAPFTISATGGGSGLPVTFASTDTTVCTVSGATSGVNGSGNGTGSATVTVLKPGTCAIKASQAGAGAYPSAPDVTQSFTVQPAPLTVTASSPSIPYGGTAPAITPSYSGFLNNETSSALTTQATCSVAANSGAAGTYQTTCAGAVDPNYSFTYVPGTLTISTVPLTVTANNKSMTYGASVPTFDASYSGFVNGDTSSVVSGLTCGAKDSSNNPVSGSTPVGTYPITCSGGTAANYALRYQPGTLTITKANTSLTLAPTTASVFGQPVTFTATLAVTSPGAGHPSGTVEFKDGSTDISGCSAQSVSTTTETATCTTPALSVATHNITAAYSGDTNFTGSTAAAQTQTVNKAATSLSLLPSSPVTRGQAVTFTAVITATAPGAGTPTGTVTFFDRGKSLGTGQLSVVGGKDQATFSTSSLAVGAHSITASYGGDGSFLTSTSAALTQYINTNLSSYPKLPSGAYNLSNANLSGGYFVGMSLAGASLTGANLTNAVFTGANLTGANLSNSNFMGSSNFTNANLSGANLSNSNLKGANFSGVNLNGVNFTGSNLTGATGLKTATLTSVVWSMTTCPDGTSSSSDGGTCMGHF